MRLAHAPAFYPGRTLVYPYQAGDPVVDTEVDLYGEHRVYLGRTETFEAAKLMAASFTAGQRKTLLRLLDAAPAERVAELEAELAEARRLVEVCRPILDAANAAA